MPEEQIEKEIYKIVLPKTPLNRSLRILITMNTIMVFIVGMFAPFYAIFVQHIGGSIAFAGMSWALLSIVSGFLILLFAKWQLRIKEQELLVALGYLIRAIVFLSYAFMRDIPQLLFTQVLWGIAAAIGTPAFDAVYAAHTTRESSIVQWGEWEGISAIASGFAAVIGGIVIQSFGYPTVFVCMSLLSAGIGIYIYRLPRDVL